MAPSWASAQRRQDSESQPQGTHRMAYNAWRLERPTVTPPYIRGETWAIDTWWALVPPKTER